MIHSGNSWGGGGAELTPAQKKDFDEVEDFDGVPVAADFGDTTLLKDENTGMLYSKDEHDNVREVGHRTSLDTDNAIVNGTDKGLYVPKLVKGKAGEPIAADFGTAKFVFDTDTGIPYVLDGGGDPIPVVVGDILALTVKYNDDITQLGLAPADLNVQKAIEALSIIPEVDTLGQMTRKNEIYRLKADVGDDKAGYYAVDSAGTVRAIGARTKVKEVATVAEMTDKQSIYLLTAKDGDNDIGYYGTKSDGTVIAIGKIPAYTDLPDTINDYADLALNIMRVNAAEDAVEAVILTAALVKYDDALSQLGLAPADQTTQKAIERLKQLLDGLPDQVTTDDIAARDALPDVQANTIAHVKDASADATVTSGWCKYQYIDGAWFKYLAQEDLNILDLDDAWRVSTHANYGQKGLTSFEQIDTLYKFDDTEIMSSTNEKLGLPTPKQLWEYLSDKPKQYVDMATATGKTIPREKFVIIGVGEAKSVYYNHTTSDAVFSEASTDFTQITGEKYDNATAWQPSHEYKAGEAFYFVPTEDNPKDKNDKELLKDIRYLGLYPVDTTSSAALDNAEVLNIETINPPIKIEDTYDHLLAVKSYTGAVKPTGIAKGERVLSIDDNEIYVSNGDDTYTVMDKTKFNDFMEVNVKDPEKNYRFKKADGTFVEEVAASAMRVEVEEEADMKALPAKEYMRCKIKATASEYEFVLTDDLTPEQTADVKNIDNDDATGKWVYQIDAPVNSLHRSRVKSTANQSSDSATPVKVNLSKIVGLDANGMVDTANHEVVIKQGGDYKITGEMSLGNENHASEHIYAHIFVNGAEVTKKEDRIATDASSELTATITKRLEVGDKVDLRFSVAYGTTMHFKGELGVEQQPTATVEKIDPNLVTVENVLDDEIHITDIRNDGVRTNITFAQEPAELKIGIRVWDGHMIYQALSFSQIKAETFINGTARGMNDKDNEHEDFGIQYQVAYVSDTEVGITVTDAGYLASDNTWYSRNNADYRIEKVVAVYKANKTIIKLDPNVTLAKTVTATFTGMTADGGRTSKSIYEGTTTYTSVVDLSPHKMIDTATNCTIMDAEKGIIAYQQAIDGGDLTIALTEKDNPVNAYDFQLVCDNVSNYDNKDFPFNYTAGMKHVVSVGCTVHHNSEGNVAMKVYLDGASIDLRQVHYWNHNAEAGRHPMRSVRFALPDDLATGAYTITLGPQSGTWVYDEDTATISVERF